MNNNITQDPLDSIFFTGESIDRELLANTLAPFVKIYVQSGKVEIIFTDAGRKLSARGRILVYLLARKAIFLRDSTLLEEEAVTPAEIEADTHIPGGTVRPTLKKLADARRVQVDASKYSVRNYALPEIYDELTKGGDQ